MSAEAETDGSHGGRPLAGIRIADLCGQLAGAGSTRTLAALGAEVIRVEDPANHGAWDILRGAPPYVDDRRGRELGGAFNNHNVGKRGITLNLRHERGRELLTQLIEVSDVVTENFAPGVLDRLGFSYDVVKEIRPDIIYATNSGFGHTGPYSKFRMWGPIVQAVSGLSTQSRLPGEVPAGFGYSYMDHHAANFMTIAILAALRHRRRTGEGQRIDVSSVAAGIMLSGPFGLQALLEHTSEPETPGYSSNRSRAPLMSPHGVFPLPEPDRWVAIAVRNEADWHALSDLVPGLQEPAIRSLDSAEKRIEHEEQLEQTLRQWTSTQPTEQVLSQLGRAEVPHSLVKSPQERIEGPATANWPLWPTVDHPEMGTVPVEGLPIQLSDGTWEISEAAPVLGQHSREVLGELLGVTPSEFDELKEAGTV